MVLLTLALLACKNEPLDTGYPDADGDGYSAEVDCDDDNAAIFPDAEEICDGIDNDCDEAIDSADDDIAEGETTTWFNDGDGDGYGAPDRPITACDQPTGAVLLDTDCNDGDPAISPDADEVCDGVDNDCDGNVDPETALDALTWFADADGDGFGDALVESVSCLAPENTVSDATDCDDANQDVNPNAVEVCNDVDDDCNGDIDEDTAADALTWYQDRDADGYGDASSMSASCSQPEEFVSDATDCDDRDADVSPAGTEICNDIDDNCDTEVDEDSAADAPTWYLDADSDGYGLSTETAVQCTQPSGYVDQDGDCDDVDNAINPSAPEVCDADDTDEDCDGDADDADSAIDPSTLSVFYSDTDSDGYGDLSTATSACDAPSGTVSDATDCDDSDSAVNPGATEVCDALNTDEDCSGDADDEDTDVDSSTLSDWFEDADGDGYGTPDVSTQLCDAPSGYVSDDTDCADDSAEINPDAWEDYLDEADNDCDGSADETLMSASDASVTITGGTELGYAVVMGDIDGDGNLDLVTSEIDEDNSKTYVFLGPITSGSTLSDANADLIVSQDSDQDRAGMALALLPDLDGDGTQELLISALNSDQDYKSEASLFYGAPTGDLDMADGDATFTSATSNRLGWFDIGDAGDVDGDKVNDLFMGAPYADDEDGAIYIFSGAVTGSYSVEADADATLTGANDDLLGITVQASEDYNGDGVADIIAGTENNTVYVLYGPFSGSVDLSSDADFEITGSDDFGAEVETGDWDGDGVLDLAVGAPSDDTQATNAGAVFVLSGPISAGTSADAFATLYGSDSADNVGNKWGDFQAADLNGDGDQDMVIGARYTDYESTYDGGIYGVLGPISGSQSLEEIGHMRLYGASSNAYMGNTVATGDMDGDGLDDIFTGGFFDDEVYLFLSSDM